jgi:hypothetical protein
MYKETVPFVSGWVVPPFYQRTVSLRFEIAILLYSAIQIRGHVSPGGAERLLLPT